MSLKITETLEYGARWQEDHKGKEAYGSLRSDSLLLARFVST